jgi:hypothetical protein
MYNKTNSMQMIMMETKKKRANVNKDDYEKKK